MPELPRISGAEIVRALERLGFVKLRQSGSHVIMRRDSRGCVVPMHSEVKIGTLAGLLRQAGVSSEDFIQALRWIGRLFYGFPALGYAKRGVDPASHL